MSRLSGSADGAGVSPVARRAVGSGGALVLSLIVAWTALAASVANGGFETGDLTGWTAASATADGAWFAYSGTEAPLTGLTIPAPPQGTYAAVSDATDVGTEVLYQDLTLPADYHGSLGFSWFYVNHAPDFSASSTLDYLAAPNQQYRIDLVDPAADPFSVAPGDVLAAIVGTQPGDPATLAPTAVSVDLTPFAGRTVRLRFAAVQTEGYLQGGVDAVSIASAPSTPASAGDCKLDGWRAYVNGQGDAFRNQGDCVSWVVSMGPGSLSRPTP